MGVHKNMKCETKTSMDHTFKLGERKDEEVIPHCTDMETFVGEF